MGIRRKLRSIKQTALRSLAQLLADRGYRVMNTDPVSAYYDLRACILDTLECHPGMRCYEIERHLGLDTYKQRVTNSILRELEANELVMATGKTWDPVKQRVKHTARRYYLDI